jgi:urea transport system permease protein
MAMFLKLEASSPENTSIQSTPGIPDFMDWNQLTELPWFWEPFSSFGFTILAILIIPAAFAFVIGSAMFKRRVGGVYFAIITQVIAVILTVLIVGQQGLTGGINGITDLRTLNGWDITSDSAKYIFYFINCFLLLAVIVFSRWMLSCKFGRILLAIRDKEDRVRFSGYDVANFKIFIFCLAALISAIGGAMFTLQVGFMSPSFVGIVPSIEMVIFAAVGGRMSLVGAVYGTLLINFGKTVFSESFPELWLFLMGGLFIAVVMFFPNGLAGLWNDYGHYITRHFAFLGKGRKETTAALPVETSPVETSPAETSPLPSSSEPMSLETKTLETKKSEPKTAAPQTLAALELDELR